MLDHIRYCIEYDPEFAIMLSLLLMKRLDKYIKNLVPSENK